MFINGEWRGSEETFAVYNPATGEKIGQVVNGRKPDAYEAIQAAHNAFADWSATTAYQRSAILYRAYQIMLECKEDLARLMTREQGKPLRGGT